MWLILSSSKVSLKERYVILNEMLFFPAGMGGPSNTANRCKCSTRFSSSISTLSRIFAASISPSTIRVISLDVDGNFEIGRADVNLGIPAMRSSKLSSKIKAVCFKL